MRSSDWSSDVCSSDLVEAVDDAKAAPLALAMRDQRGAGRVVPRELAALEADFAACKGIEERQQQRPEAIFGARPHQRRTQELVRRQPALPVRHRPPPRSEEHTSELQSLMRSSYAVFCL